MDRCTGTRQVTDAELAILEALWRHQPLTVGEIAAELYPTVPSAAATVGKLLERLRYKAMVQQELPTWPRRYSATISRQTLIHESLREIAESLSAGSFFPLLASLIREGGLNATQRRFSI